MNRVLDASVQRIYRQRLRRNRLGIMLSMVAMALGLSVLLWILAVLVSKGLGAFDWNMFSEPTAAPGTAGGGLYNAIMGSLLMVGACTLVVTPVGILAGVYLTNTAATVTLHRSLASLPTSCCRPLRL